MERKLSNTSYTQKLYKNLYCNQTIQECASVFCGLSGLLKKRKKEKSSFEPFMCFVIVSERALAFNFVSDFFPD